MSMSKPDPVSGAYAPRIRRSRSGWTWKARLALAVLACAFAGAAQAQEYGSLDLALNKIIGEIVDDGELRGRTVLVSPNSFIEMGTGRNLPLSSLLARRSVPKLRRQGARPVSGSDDEDRAVTLRGEWSIEQESGEPYLYLFIEAKQLIGNNEISTLASDDGRVPVASIDSQLLEPDIASHGRHVVDRLERNISGAGGRYLLHVRPFILQGMAQSKSDRFNRYLLGRWRPAFAGSRRFRLVGPARFDGELLGDVFVVGERIEVSLYVLDDQEGEVAAATVEMDRSLFPPGVFGPDVRGALARCASEVDAGRLEAARECYEGVRATAPGDSDVDEGVRAGLERIAGLEERARVEEAVGDVEEAIGRGELDEARRRLEDVRRLDAGHARLAELEEEVVQAEAEEERKAREAETRRRAEAERKAREAEQRAQAERERKARELEEEERRQAERRADDEAFARAKRLHTASGYRAYLARGGRHEAEARALLSEVTKPDVGDKLRDCPECPEMVVVPGGKFGRPFAVGVYEVTFAEWDACVSGGGCGGYRPDDRGWGRGRLPVIYVSWDDAKAYVAWLSGRMGEAYRLLSESEWEYVARAGTTMAYWWGGKIGRNRANCDGCGSRWDRQTAPVGSFEANPFGLYDVHGNVWEWVEDCWEGDCSVRVLRGGSWFDRPWALRSANRGRNTTHWLRSGGVGFRVARTLMP